MSKGEEIVAQLLKKNKLFYKREVSFPDLKSFKGKPLRFDFAVYQKNKLACLIEIDGEQHFKYIPKFHKTIFDFKQSQERDRKKNSYCLAKGIPLIRIPYWAYDSLTIQDIFTNSSYRVKSQFHTDLLCRG